jgi:hypothetical protein
VLVTPPVSPGFGEHHAQLRDVGPAMYLSEPAPRQSAAMMGLAVLSISQSASRSRLGHQPACSLTDNHWLGGDASLRQRVHERRCSTF